MNYITLNNGVKIPQIGLGVFRTPDGADTANAVKWAIEAGYRHIDTAKVYGNEKSVGEGIRMSGVDRRDIFVTTKLWNEDIRQGRTKEAFLQTLEDMGLDYIDLYLIHWPANGYEKAWADMEDLYKAGKIKAIGVSNFNVHHLETLSENWTVVPAVNQIEIHPYYANIENVEYAKKNGIAIEAYSPLGGNGAGTLENEVIIALADKYGKTPAQIVLRWELQRGIIVLPKSTHQERIISNFEVFDFELSEGDMNAINELNKNEKHGSDPETFNF